MYANIGEIALRYSRGCGITKRSGARKRNGKRTKG